MNPRANEHLYLLQQKFGSELMIDALESETAWGTTYYQIAITATSLLFKDDFSDEDRELLFKDGLAAFLDRTDVRVGNTIAQAVDVFFLHCLNKGIF